MKKVLGLILALCAVGCDRDAAPAGEGSTAAGKAMFTEIARSATGTVPPGYFRIECGDGSWIAARGIDSHDNPEGGTVGVVTNTGEAAVFFTHVCGPGPDPLVSLFTDTKSSRGALESLRVSSTATEFKR